MMKSNTGILERLCKKIRRSSSRGKSSKIRQNTESSQSFSVRRGKSPLEDTITRSNQGRLADLTSSGDSLIETMFLPPSQDQAITPTACKAGRSCSVPNTRARQVSTPPRSPSRQVAPEPSTRSRKQEPSLKVIDTSRKECDHSHTSDSSPGKAAREDLYMLSASDSGLYSEAEESPGEEEYLNVFTDEEEEEAVLGDSWVIPAQEVSLDKMMASNTHETIYSGYWHGNVSVHARYSNTTELKRRVLSDVSALANIRHENIQLFLGVCHDLHSDYISIVMDQMKGLTLHTLIHKQGHQFNFQSLTKIVSQVSQGLEYLHAKGISHPLLTSQSVTLHYRVCISMLTPGSASMGLINSSDLPYLPPEAIRTVKKYSNTSQASLTCPSSPHSVHGLRTRCTSGNRLAYRFQSVSPRSTPTSPNIKSSRRQFECAGYLSPGGLLSGALLSTRRGSCDDTQAEGTSEDRVQLKGNRSAMQSPQANIFSFGTLLYELITLEKPYQHTPGNLIIYQVSKGLVQDLKHLRDGKFKQMIKKCWRSEASSRPSFRNLQTYLEQNMSPKSCGLTKSHFSFSVPNQLDKLGSHAEGTRLGL